MGWQHDGDRWKGEELEEGRGLFESTIPIFAQGAEENCESSHPGYNNINIYDSDDVIKVDSSVLVILLWER